MTETFLDKIFAAKGKRVKEQKEIIGVEELAASALRVRLASIPHRFAKSFRNTGRLDIIAEIKRASPSKGVINDNIDVASVARSYESGGACAISVLTEEDFFLGSMEDLRTVRRSVDLPVLRKDFVFDEFQIYEAANAGADAILLIAAMLNDETLERLHTLATDILGMDALVEVHNIGEFNRAKSLGATLIGVNNRDLHSFNVSIDVSRSLIKHAGNGAIMISESGLRNREEMLELQQLGFNGFLIGETLMTSLDAVSELSGLLED